MSVSAGKFAPSAVVVAFVGYCLWPTVSQWVSTPNAPQPAGKAVELAASLFSPKLGPAPTTNPFGGLDAASLAEAIKNREAASLRPSTQSKDTTNKAAVRKVDPLAGLRLEATCILGDQHLAIINGKTYAPEELLAADGSAMPPRKVVRVLPDMVVLECQGKTAELKYSSVSDKAAAAKTDAPGKAAGSGQPSFLTKLKQLSKASNAVKPSPSGKTGK